MKPNEFSPHRRIEHEFRRSIDALISKYFKLPEESTPEAILRAFANFGHSPNVLEDIATKLAKRMITMVRVSNAKSWRVAAMEESRGHEIYMGLQNEMQGAIGASIYKMVKENAQLISSIPAYVQEKANADILRLQQEGERPETIAKHLMSTIPKLSKSRAKLIARTETGKAATALTRARSQSFGIEWYQWATSEDQRVRPAHRIMDKVLVRWNDPPNPENLAHVKNNHGPYNAGNIYNCRCDSYPVISLNMIKWPAKVYHSGKITRMTRADFVQFSGAPLSSD